MDVFPFVLFAVPTKWNGYLSRDPKVTDLLMIQFWHGFGLLDNGSKVIHESVSKFGKF
jgi:hypothetical protein